LVAVLVVLCAGCRLSVSVNVGMKADGSGTVTVSAVADAELVAKAPTVFGDLRLDDVKTAGWTVAGPAKAADGSIRLVLTKAFRTPAEATTILNELNGPAGPLHDVRVELTQSFAHVRSSFEATARLDGGLAAFSDTALVKALGGKTPLADRVTTPVEQGMRLSVTARLPGAVVTSNGTVSADRSTTAWTPSLAKGATTAMQARFDQTDEGALRARRRSHLAWIAFAGYAALFVLVVVTVTLVARHRRHRHRSADGP
jgi:hypothetical protein